MGTSNSDERSTGQCSLLRFNISGVFCDRDLFWLKSASNKCGRVKSMENFIKISAHINNLIVCFGSFFSNDSMSRNECMKYTVQSLSLHRKLICEKDLNSYDKHIHLAKKTYKIMFEKIKSQQIVDDIIFCGDSELSWEETRTFLRNLYGIDMHSKEIYAFYYLHEINDMRYIDSPLPSRQSAYF